jgi:hypothetical protein
MPQPSENTGERRRYMCNDRRGLRSQRYTLSIHEVTLIAQRAAAKTSPSLAVSGVTLGGGEGSEYVEILVSVDGCEAPPCRVAIGAFRGVEASLLEETIAQALQTHTQKRSR